jgi:hypothetical protein
LLNKLLPGTDLKPSFFLTSAKDLGLSLVLPAVLAQITSGKRSKRVAKWRICGQFMHNQDV